MPVTNLPGIQREMVQYGMTVYLALGLMGNIFNCIMFAQNSYRRTPSSIYLLSLSIGGIICLLSALVPPIYTLSHIDPQTQSVFFCKFRLYATHTFGQYIRYCIVFACADRYFITRTNARIRSFNSIRTAIKLLLIMCVVSNNCHACAYIDRHTKRCTMPPILMISFSILTVRSLRQRHAAVAQEHIRQRDHYLTRMVIAEVTVNIVTSVPYSANLMYGAVTYYVTDKSSQRLEIESFITFATQFQLYLISVAPFYVFILTSKPFRNEFVNLFINGWKKWFRRGTQVIPTHAQSMTATNRATAVHDKQ